MRLKVDCQSSIVFDAEFVSIPEGAIEGESRRLDVHGRNKVSIPEGAIEGGVVGTKAATKTKFQYPKVRLKAPLRRSKSIFCGCFNTRRCD